MIRCYLQKQQQWDHHLQQIASAIRATQHRQTGFTPNLMMLGREVDQPIDLMLGTVTEGKNIHTTSDYVSGVIEQGQKAHMITREHLRGAQFRQKRDYDVMAHQRHYDIGDVVFKLDTATNVGRSPKLQQPWNGPFLVVEVKSPVLYRIKGR
ncbi:uncharacterized protein LOC110465118 [Mizuhopecten yessoensis]|uniref:uncharacterized protein LOC110465118 n=1 Tax=Mizuhopecten yessoensis TaxID=6573 RepID=UPI000B45EEE7|nr:uncharacterized protein LOC110465118 [Mizuhopecten yessoensis]